MQSKVITSFKNIYMKILILIIMMVTLRCGDGKPKGDFQTKKSRDASTAIKAYLNNIHNDKSTSLSNSQNLLNNFAKTYIVTNGSDIYEKILLVFPLKNIYLHRYKRRTTNTPKFVFNEEMRSNFDMFAKIEGDYNLHSNILLNRFLNCKFQNHKKGQFSKYYSTKLIELASILSQTFHTEDGSNSNEQNLLTIYNQFQKFKSFIKNEYKLDIIKKKTNSNHSYKKYIANLKSGSKKNVNFSDLIIEILCSENYEILFKIFPELDLMFKLKANKISKIKIITVLRIFQLMIYKFELFRSNFLNGNLNKISLEQLYSNQEFNETISIISLLLKEIMEIIYGKKNEVLELLNFIYFIRAKYYNYFLEQKDLQFVFKIVSKGEIDHTKKHDYIIKDIQINFTNFFKRTLFYKTYKDMVKMKKNNKKEMTYEETNQN
ncbi:hypothetical protein H312_01032 [Anncaliia algerae PRA339]|uniref:Uncharacterized protein n=1 Tax=Anncaliia algerae PRA339 TaxID=1288291 RepID=A0A059F3C8_9MICR|nr:hypothetical protein H312_01032 [Anncaliia algerae PRA339]